MAKLYTLDGKLLTETPEVRIGDKLYPVDDRTKTVKQILRAVSESRAGAQGGESDPEAAMQGMHQALALAYGPKALEEIKPDELPFAAYQRLIEVRVAAVTGEEPDAAGGRFPQPQPPAAE